MSLRHTFTEIKIIRHTFKEIKINNRDNYCPKILRSHFFFMKVHEYDNMEKDVEFIYEP